MSKYLIEKRNDLITRAEEVLNKAKEEQRELTDAEAQELAEIKDDVRRIKETLGLEDDFREMAEMEVKPEEEPKEERALETRSVKVGKETLLIREDEYKAFDAFIRGHERADMTKGANGAIIPTSVANWIIKKVYDISPILERSQKFNTKGNVQIPYYPADSNVINVAYADEFTALTGSAGKFGSVTLTGFLAGALTKISRSLINNADIDVVGFVVDDMAEALKRFIEHELLIGTPAVGQTPAKVLGLSTLTNGITAGSATAITADEVIRLHDKVKDAYQNDAIWIMSSATRTALRLLKATTTGVYLLNDDISSPFGTTLLGKPVYVSDNMPDIATGNTVIYYGDMKGLATKFAEEIDIQILREKFADEHADGVIGWVEFDGKVADEQRIAKLTMA